MRQGSRFVGACAAAFLAIVGLWLGGCSRKPLAIHVVVEDRLSGPLAGSVATFAADLRDAGYAVTVDGSRSAAQSPDELREALRQAWLASGKSLDGVVLVGEFSAALFNVGFRQGDPYWHDHLADLFYMDVDGLWGDADANGVFDSHRSYGDGWLGSLGNWMAERGIASIDRRLPEFWVSRLRAGTMAPLGDELELYRDYFRRNHEYRTSGPGPIPPRAFVVGPGAKLSESGWGARPRRLYRDSSVKECTKTASSEVRGFLADPRGWSLGIVGSFSGPQVHKFQYYEGGGFDATQFATIEGRKLIAEYSAMRHDPWDLASPEIAQLRPKVLFYQLLSSETGRHDVPGYLGGAYVFFGSGLAAIAGTQHSGAIGVPVVYDALEEGDSIGNAWRRGIAWSIENAGPSLTVVWCDGSEPWDPSADAYKAVLLGDGSLRLPAENR